MNNTADFWEGFEPLRAYMDGERAKMGWGPADIRRLTGTYMYGHWFTRSQWVLISEEHYTTLQQAAAGKAFLRPYNALHGDAANLDTEYQGLKEEFYASRAYFDNTHEIMTDVWLYPRVLLDDRFEHPTPKPVEMIARIIKSSAPPASLVVSPFLGSGTDLVAAEQCGRICYGMELAPQWVAASLERAQRVGLAPRCV
jgi:hypothetical protein